MLRGIPAAAHGYVVNGRTPLEWAVERLHIGQDEESGIVNDPNAWFADDTSPPSTSLENPITSRKYSTSFDSSWLQLRQEGTVIKGKFWPLGKRHLGGVWSHVLVFLFRGLPQDTHLS